LLGNILPTREFLASKIAFTGLPAHYEVAEHAEDVEHSGLAGAVPADDQLLGGRLELEIHKAAIIGRV